jgi:hypothetical protein
MISDNIFPNSNIWYPIPMLDPINSGDLYASNKQVALVTNSLASDMIRPTPIETNIDQTFILTFTKELKQLTRFVCEMLDRWEDAVPEALLRLECKIYRNR